jgi:hypothetical protein
MSHHISNLPGGFSETDQLARLRAEMQRFKTEKELGATGRFPRGKLCNEDDGEIKIDVTCDMKTATVLINFGKPVEFIGFTADQAIDLAELLQRRADEVRGRKD